MTTTIKRLIAPKEYWPQFCEKYPELALSGTVNSWIWFNREHTARMLESGGLIRMGSRRLLVDPDKFDPAAYSLLTVGRLPGGES